MIILAIIGRISRAPMATICPRCCASRAILSRICATLRFERYTSPDFFARELEHMWKRVWQFARREVQLAEVGDYHVYDLAQLSVVIVRTEVGRKACTTPASTAAPSSSHPTPRAGRLRCDVSSMSENGISRVR